MRRLIGSALAFSALLLGVSCSSSTLDCPGIASACPSGCVAVEGSVVDADAVCLEPVMTQACITEEAAATVNPVQTCLKRKSDDATVILKGDVTLPADAWDDCTNTEIYEVATARQCE